MTKTIAGLLAVALLLAGSASAGATRLVAASMARSVTDGTVPEGITDAFPPDAPAIHAVVVFADAEAGTKVRGSWVAVDAIQTPNYEIDSTTVALGAGEQRTHFQLSRPKNGWPQGHYKLNLYLDGTLVTAVPFQVGQAAGSEAFAPPSSPPSQGHAQRSPSGAATPPAPSVVGAWQCRMSMNGTPVGAGAVSFGADGRATIGGRPFRYQMRSGNVLRLQDASGYSDYTYELSDAGLTMRYSDGSAFACTRPAAGGGAMGAAARGGPPGHNRTVGAGGGAAGGGTGNEWQLQGTFCHTGGSSSYSSSSSYSGYSHTERITFDGHGHWSFGSEAAFSSNAGLYSRGGGGAEESGRYRVVGRQIQYQTASGEQGVAQVKVQQNDGRITEITVEGTLYSPFLCE